MGEVGRFHTFVQLLLHEAGFTADLDGGREQGQGGRTSPYPLMSPFSFVLELFLHLSVLAGVGHTHQPRAGETELQRTGGVETKREHKYYYLPLLPSFLSGISNFLPASADIATNLYFCILFAPFSSSSASFSLSRCLSGLSDRQSRAGCLLLHSVEQLFKGVSGT